MKRLYKYVSLVAAKLVGRRHVRDIQLPGMRELLNAFISKSDSAITVRPDFNPISESLLGVGAATSWAGTDDDDDYLNSASGMYGTDDVVFFSKIAPLTWDGSTSEIASSSYTSSGTASITTGTSTLTCTDSEWVQNVWPGCLVEIDDPSPSKYYVIESIDGDGQITLTTNFAEATKSNVNCKIHLIHQINHSDYKLNIQAYTSGIIYSCPTITMPVNSKDICGPFYAAVVETSTDQVWADFIDDDVEVDAYPSIGDSSDCIATDGTNWMAVAMALDGSQQIVKSTDPTSDWSTVTAPANFVLGGQVMQYGGRFYFAGQSTSPSNAPGYAYTDDLGGSWTVKRNSSAAATYKSTGIATDGSRILISMGSSTANNEFAYYTDDDGSTWTTCTLDTASVPGVGSANAYYLNGYFILPSIGYGATRGTVYSSDGDVFSLSFLQSTGGAPDRCAYSTSGGFFAFTNGSAYVTIVNDITSSLAPSIRNTGINISSNPVFDGEKFLIGGNLGRIRSTSDFVTFELEHTSSWSECLHIAGAYSTTSKECVMLCEVEGPVVNRPFQVSVSGQSQTTTTWNQAEFSPLSVDYRALSHSVLDGYVVLFGTREYQSVNNSWTYYPRRIRWTTPLTYNDFSSSGSGAADLDGSGSLLDSRPVNGRIVTFESSAIGSLSPRGYASDPWEYDKIKDNIRTISNPVVVDDVCYFVDDSGLLRTTNGITVDEPPFSFDLTEYDDFNSDKPVWLAYSPEFECLIIYNPSGSGRYVYMIEPSTGSVSRIQAARVNSLDPKSFVCVENSDDRRAMITYNPITEDTDELVCAELSTGSTITGKDEWTSEAGDDTYFVTDIQTPEDYVVSEGTKTGIKHIIMRTYCDGTSENTNPVVAVLARSLEDSGWSSNGDTNGTITVTDAACTGTGTAWSNLIKAGDDTADAITLPCLATQARIFYKTGGVFSDQKVAGTDYTITDTKEIKPTAALASGTDLYAYWENEPQVKVEVGDLIQTTEGWHRITAVTNATSMTLDHYLSTGSDATATHHPAERMPVGDGEVKIGLLKLTEGLRLRFIIMPDASGDATVAKITGYSIGHIPAGEKIVEV